MEEDKTITKPNPSSILQLQAATITNTTTTSTTTAATIANPPATVPTTTAPAILQTKVLPTINATATNIPTSESRKNVDDQVKPQRLSDDSDTTLQSELENADTRALLGVPAVDSKAFSSRHALDQILHPNSGQAITAARMEVEVDVGADNTDKIDQCEAYKKPQKGAGANDGGEGEEAAVAGCGDTGENIVATENETTPTGSIRSIGSLVCRICHNSENPDKLVSPCLCKGSLTYVHVYCLERWISTSRSTVCELCQFQYNTEQTLRYTCFQSLRMWYSRSMSRRALQEDCQMFSLLTLVAFGIIGTLLVGIQYYFLQGRTWGLSRIWTKGWLIFFLLTTVLAIYFINIYMIVRSQLAPWYRWWQSARDIKLILENRKPFKFRQSRRLQNRQVASDLSHMSMLHPYSPQQHQIPELNYPDQVQPPAAAPIPPPPPPPPTPTTANIAITAIDMGASDEELTCRKLPLASAASVCCVAMTASATIEIPLEGYLYEFDTVS